MFFDAHPVLSVFAALCALSFNKLIKFVGK